MTDSATPSNVTTLRNAARKRGVASAHLSKPDSMTRKNRWKRRGLSDLNKRLLIGGALAAVAALALLIIISGSSRAVIGPDGPFGEALAASFPEADSRRIETRYDADGSLPLSATLHVPAHLLDAGLGVGDPFARLGAEFGGSERTLSGLEMAERLERIAAAVLPEDLSRCHTYKVGEISSPPEASARTRALHIHLNPGC